MQNHLVAEENQSKAIPLRNQQKFSQQVLKKLLKRNPGFLIT
jgi:hypothetical protein